MTDKTQTELKDGDEVFTISEDGKSADPKKKPTEAELRKAEKAKTDADAGDDEDESTGHEGGEDERNAAGSGESAEELEARKVARRDARKARKNHRREREAQKDADLAQLRDELAAVKAQVGTVTQNASNQTIAIVDQRISEATQARDLADAALEVAISKNDGKSAREAIKTRDLAAEALRQLGDYKMRYEAQSKQQPQNAQNQPNPLLVNYARQFKQDNPWVDFNTTSADEDSQKVHRLDASVLKAGYDPATPEYWDELQDRVDRAFPAKLSEAAEEQEEEDNGGGGSTRRSNGQSRSNGGARRGPAMSGGRSSVALGKNDAVVTPFEKKQIMDAGYWNNPADRADMLKRLRASKEKYGAAK